MINFVIGYLMFFILFLSLYLYFDWITLLIFTIIFGITTLDETIVYIKRKIATIKNKRIIRQSWNQ